MTESKSAEFKRYTGVETNAPVSLMGPGMKLTRRDIVELGKAKI